MSDHREKPPEAQELTPEERPEAGGPETGREIERRTVGGNTTRPATARPKKRRGIRGLLGKLQQAGKDAIAGSVERALRETRAQEAQDDLDADDDQQERAKLDAARREQSSSLRVRMLHSVTEHLRGAADEYIAAKLDEIEARVDAKLDHIEVRFDEKIDNLQTHLRQMRDEELRHRLRLLRITLIFTTIVAVLSIGYKLAASYLVGG